MFDRLDVLVLVGSVLLIVAVLLGLAFLAAYRRPQGPGERLVSRGAGRVILRAFTRGGDVSRWN